MKRWLILMMPVLAAAMATGCAKVWDSAPMMGGVRTWHDDERHVTCWITGSTAYDKGIAISCLYDFPLDRKVSP